MHACARNRTAANVIKRTRLFLITERLRIYLGGYPI